MVRLNMNSQETTVPGFVGIDGRKNKDEKDGDLPKAKSSKKSGGFQSMGLSFNVLKGVIKRGYKIPTPIQRKTIPLVMEGYDVVGMARTGSGKTACFLIPMFEKLKQRAAKAGARALILSPTRELALQTLKFIKDLGRFTDLKSAVILGGDSMEDQFSVLHGNPDIIVATPGRFLHVCVEMDLKLNSIEYVVFDEADRLFEMGLGQQLSEVIARLPDSRQTVLFSATLPKVLVEFAKAGLSDPVLIRLDVESKLPTELELFYFNVRQDEKLAALLLLLKTFVDKDQKTVIFAATKHHVEYLHMVLEHMGMENTYIYSDLDSSARKIHCAKFSTGKVKFLVVTDVAARGIDIPYLDNVINYNFPGKAKLFVHRVGRCARAGRSGKAFSLVTPDEYAHLLDLHLFLGSPVSICTAKNKKGNFGTMPQHLIEEQQGILHTLHGNHTDLVNLKKVSERGFLQYMRSRPTASIDSNKRVKEMPFENCYTHPLFRKEEGTLESKKQNILDEMKSYRPHGTIFEIYGKTKSVEYLTMKEKRVVHQDKIVEHRNKTEKRLAELSVSEQQASSLADCDQEDISKTFKSVIMPKKRKIADLYRKSQKKSAKSENYIPYIPADQHTEMGLAVNNFQTEAKREEVEIVGDSSEAMHLANKLKKWDRKKKKMVGVESVKAGKIKTESGVWISASYKSNRYNQWKEKNKVDHENEDSSADEGDKESFSADLFKGPKKHWQKHNEKLKQQQQNSELKTAAQVLKTRRIAARKKRQHLQKKKKGNKSKGKHK